MPVSLPIERPPLPARPNDAGWDYMSSYFLQGVYRLIERNEYGDAADQYMTRILETHSDNPAVLRLAAHVFLRSSNLAAAEAVLADQLRADPGSPELLARRGFVRERRGFPGLAARDYADAAATTDDEQLRRYAESAASRLAERLPELRREEAAAWTALQPELEPLRQAANWQDIAKLTETFLNEWPESSPARLERANALAELGQYPAAREMVELIPQYEQDADTVRKAERFLREVLEPASQKDEWEQARAESPKGSGRLPDAPDRHAPSLA